VDARHKAGHDEDTNSGGTGTMGISLHRHFRGAETTYLFTSVEQLMVDFWSDVRTVRGGE
jgi:hypothetical protein